MSDRKAQDQEETGTPVPRDLPDQQAQDGEGPPEEAGEGAQEEGAPDAGQDSAPAEPTG
ncbi:hypothetical protein ACWDZ4_25545 [Streptomyces sp. NPDC003016]